MWLLCLETGICLKPGVDVYAAIAYWTDMARDRVKMLEKDEIQS